MAPQSGEQQTTRWVVDHESEGIHMLYEQTTTPPVTTMPVATIYAGQQIAELLASAPRLKAEHAELLSALKTLCEAGARGPSGHDWIRANALIARIEGGMQA